MFSAWHRLVPESQYWSPRLLHSLWKPKEIYVTENGCAASDVIAADGNVCDSDRLMRLEERHDAPAVGHRRGDSSEGKTSTGV